MNEAQLYLLKQRLEEVYVPQLPPLIDQTPPPAHQAAKNISRSLSAFTLEKLLRIDSTTASKSVVDDNGDNGIDAIYYYQPTKKLFLVQSKLRADEPFQQAEAQAFVAGIRDLIYQRYERFNANVQDRQAELEMALDDAAEILLVISHTAEGVSEHAKAVLSTFLTDGDRPDERLQVEWIDFGPTAIAESLLAENAVEPVDDSIVFFGERKIEEPHVAYYGQVEVAAMARLYGIYGNRLLEKNIRYFLGVNSSAVNRAINTTLDVAPTEFFYLSNGITAVAHTIEPRAAHDGWRRYEVQGFSIINGAQTVASCHHYASTRPDRDIGLARVMLTLIKVDRDSQFSSAITRARNHQNPVALTQFAALDGTQERLRRELALHNIVYRYRLEAKDRISGMDLISIGEAATALALCHPNPHLPVLLKREPSKLLDSTGSEYATLFNSNLAGARLANAVRLCRSASATLAAAEQSSHGREKLVYRHGRYAIMWLTFGANRAWLDRNDVMGSTDASTVLSAPLDGWRERVRSEVAIELDALLKGPLAFFRTLTHALPFISRLRDAGL